MDATVHGEVAAEVRRWYTESTPSIGVQVDPHWFGFVARGPGSVGRRAIITVDRPDELAAALAEASRLCGPEATVIIDDRAREARLGPELAARGYSPEVASTYLALVGRIASDRPLPTLAIEEAADSDLPTWAAVKIQGFADDDTPPVPARMDAEVAQRRAEAPLARYLIGRLDEEPVGALAHYTGSDQLVFSLATRLPFRHRGVAQALLAHWVDDGMADACRSFIINADDGGRPAALYQRLGFAHEVYWQRRFSPA